MRRGSTPRREGYFYPRPPRGGRRRAPPCTPRSAGDFYPRPPRGGRRKSGFSRVGVTHFYPRPPRGGRRRRTVGKCASELISIHALREEGDGKLFCGECGTAIFLSTPSARRATGVAVFPEQTSTFLSTPSARRATSGHSDSTADIAISIHALREEGDQSNPLRVSAETAFLSTPSARRATLQYRLRSRC